MAKRTQIWLAELGLYYYKARIYSTTLGRFLQTDLIGYEDQYNLYAYVGNDPVNATDPTGMQGCHKKRAGCPRGGERDDAETEDAETEGAETVALSFNFVAAGGGTLDIGLVFNDDGDIIPDGGFATPAIAAGLDVSVGVTYLLFDDKNDIEGDSQALSAGAFIFNISEVFDSDGENSLGQGGGLSLGLTPVNETFGFGKTTVVEPEIVVTANKKRKKKRGWFGRLLSKVGL